MTFHTKFLVTTQPSEQLSYTFDDDYICSDKKDWCSTNFLFSMWESLEYLSKFRAFSLLLGGKPILVDLHHFLSLTILGHMALRYQVRLSCHLAFGLPLFLFYCLDVNTNRWPLRWERWSTHLRLPFLIILIMFFITVYCQIQVLLFCQIRWSLVWFAPFYIRLLQVFLQWLCCVSMSHFHKVITSRTHSLNNFLLVSFVDLRFSCL